MSGSRRAFELVSFGDISTDVLVQVSRLPRRDEKQWATWVGEFPGGMGANVAATFAKLGGSAALVTSVGDDSRGEASLADLRSFGVDVSNVITVPGPTFWTIGLLDERGEKSLLEFSTPAFSPSWDRVDHSVLAGARVAYTTGYEATHVLALFRECRDRGILTALDLENVDPADLDTLTHVVGTTDILFSGPAAARALTGIRSVAGAARVLLEWGPRVLAYTMGAQGCAVFAGEGPGVRLRGHPVRVRDTTGAGDCFAGAFLFGFVRGWEVRACAELANLMAAMSVTSYGCRGNIIGLQDLRALPEARALSFARISDG